MQKFAKFLPTIDEILTGAEVYDTRDASAEDCADQEAAVLQCFGPQVGLPEPDAALLRARRRDAGDPQAEDHQARTIELLAFPVLPADSSGRDSCKKNIAYP